MPPTRPLFFPHLCRCHCPLTPSFCLVPYMVTGKVGGARYRVWNAATPYYVTHLDGYIYTAHFNPTHQSQIANFQLALKTWDTETCCCSFTVKEGAVPYYRVYRCLLVSRTWGLLTPLQKATASKSLVGETDWYNCVRVASPVHIDSSRHLGSKYFYQVSLPTFQQGFWLLIWLSTQLVWIICRKKVEQLTSVDCSTSVLVFSFSGNCSRCLIFNVCGKGLVTLGRFYSVLNRVQYRFMYSSKSKSAVCRWLPSPQQTSRDKSWLFSHILNSKLLFIKYIV